MPGTTDKISAQGLLALLFAVSAIFVLSPLLFWNHEQKLVYAAICSALLYASNAVPIQLVGAPALVLLPHLVPQHVLGQTWIEALRSLAAALLCGGLVHSSSFMSRSALFFLVVAGTRVRALALALTAAAAALAPVLGPAAAAFFLATLCAHLVQFLRTGPFKTIQRRCSFHRVTRELTVRERRSLARFIFREECALPADGRPPDALETTELMDDYAPLESAPVQPPADISRQPRRLSRIKLLLPLSPQSRRGSVGSLHRVVMPGESSPERLAKSLRSDTHAAFLEPIVFGDPLLLDIVLWHPSRYTKLHAYLLYGTLLVHALFSMVSLTGSAQNNYLLDYGRRITFARQLTSSSWVSLAWPTAVISCVVLCSYVHRVLLDSFDAEEDFKASKLSRTAVDEARRGVAVQGYRELFPLVCLGVWLLRSQFADSLEELFLNDYSVLFLLLSWISVPFGNKPGGRKAVETVFRSIPWGSLLLILSQLVTQAAWPALSPAVSSAITRLSNTLRGQRPFVMQAALTAAASLFTEIMGAELTVKLLLPAAATLAEERLSPWLYLAVPITAASGIGIILPMASVHMAVIHDMADIGPGVTVLPGITVKVTAILTLLLGTNLMGRLVFGWSDQEWTSEQDQKVTTDFAFADLDDI